MPVQKDGMPFLEDSWQIWSGKVFFGKGRWKQSPKGLEPSGPGWSIGELRRQWELVVASPLQDVLILHPQRENGT
jgi:hypothetical protein